MDDPVMCIFFPAEVVHVCLGAADIPVTSQSDQNRLEYSAYLHRCVQTPTPEYPVCISSHSALMYFVQPSSSTAVTIHK